MHNPIYYQFGTLCMKYVQAVAVQLCSVLALHLSQMFLSLPLDDLAIDLGSIVEEKKAPPPPPRARLYSVVQYSYCVLSPVLSKARLDEHMRKSRNPHKGSRLSALQCAVSPQHTQIVS